jgi:hypothetical protein
VTKSACSPDVAPYHYHMKDITIKTSPDQDECACLTSRNMDTDIGKHGILHIKQR